MLEVWYLDKKTCKIKGFAEASKYDLGRDIEFSEKSKVVVPNRPELQNDDYVVVRDGEKIAFQGICDSISVGKAPYTLTLKQMECMFDRTVFVDHEEYLKDSSQGIEGFIANAIRTNFLSSGDDLLDKRAVTVYAATHTAKDITVSSIVDANNGIYNLKTFLGNVREMYGIFLEMQFATTSSTNPNPSDPAVHALAITVRKRTYSTLDVDTHFTDVMDYDETYTVNVLAKLNVKWGIPDNDYSYVDEDTETLYVGNQLADVQYLTYYLQSDRTITDDVNSPTRVDGTVKSIYVETDDEDELVEQILNEFVSNKYEHKLTFKLSVDSQLYSRSDFVVGRSVRIKSKKTGLITESLITKITESSNSDIYTVTLGKLPVTLIDKIRRL